MNNKKLIMIPKIMKIKNIYSLGNLKIEIQNKNLFQKFKMIIKMLDFLSKTKNFDVLKNCFSIILKYLIICLNFINCNI